MPMLNPPTPGTSQSIALDADAVRREVAKDGAEYHELSTADIAAIVQFSDDQIRAALVEASDDDYWRAYEDTCDRAISLLRRQIRP